MRYEDDCDIYIIDADTDEIGWCCSDTIIQRGALVKCAGLVKASHLNGKQAWVESYDTETERHVVQFEEEDRKSCLVKPENLRILFFGDEFELELVHVVEGEKPELAAHLLRHTRPGLIVQHLIV